MKKSSCKVVKSRTAVAVHEYTVSRTQVLQTELLLISKTNIEKSGVVNLTSVVHFQCT